MATKSGEGQQTMAAVGRKRRKLSQTTNKVLPTYVADDAPLAYCVRSPSRRCPRAKRLRASRYSRISPMRPYASLGSYHLASKSESPRLCPARVWLSRSDALGRLVSWSDSPRENQDATLLLRNKKPVQGPAFVNEGSTD